MKKLILIFLLLVLILPCIAQENQLLKQSRKISEKNIKNDVYQLASDKMQGRETATRGQKIAAQYIYQQFIEAGISNLNLTQDSLAYFQQFSIYKMTDTKANISLEKKQYKIYKDFSLKGFEDYSDSKMKVIFIGNAQDSSLLKKDYTDQAVVFVTPNLYAGASNAFEIAEKTNARMVLFCNPTNSKQIESDMIRQRAWQRKRVNLNDNHTPPKNPFDSLKNPIAFKTRKLLSKSYFGAIRKEAVADIFHLSINSLKQYCNGKKHLSSPIENQVQFQFENCFIQEQTENVLACIPGTDLKDEYIVISAHYDHLGKNGNKIYYGANDNASGTAAILEIARNIQNAVDKGLQLKRSILITAFSGEEKGLLGSKYFLESNRVDPLKIKANLNIDMLGRKDNKHPNSDYVYLLGTNHLNPKLKVISDSINQVLNQLKLDYTFDDPDNYLYHASDQASFVNHQIPAIFYFNGLHKDYHKETDTPDKIDYEAIQKTCRLVFLTAIELANNESFEKLPLQK